MSEERRPLEQEEITVCNKQLQRLGLQNKEAQYYIEHAQLMLKAGLEVNYVKAREEYSLKLRKVVEEQKEIQESIRILIDQINNGVLKLPAQENMGERT